jgi:hypothetical protein
VFVVKADISGASFMILVGVTLAWRFSELVHYAKKAVALYKVFEFDNCEIRNVLIMRIGHRSKMQEYTR